MAGRGSETEGIGFFFRRVSGAIYVVKGKITRRTPHPATYSWPYEGRRGIWSVLNFEFGRREFCRWYEILNLVTL